MTTPPRALFASLALVTLVSGCAALPGDGGGSSTPSAAASQSEASPTRTPATKATAASQTPSAKQSATPTPSKASVPADSQLVTAPTHGLALAVPKSWVVVTTQDTAKVDEYAKAIGKSSSTVTDMLTRNDLMATATKATDKFTPNLMVSQGTAPELPDQQQAKEIVTPQGPSATMTSFGDGPTSALGPTKVARYTVKRPTGTLAYGALGFVKVDGQAVMIITTSASESDTAKVIETALLTARAA